MYTMISYLFVVLLSGYLLSRLYLLFPLTLQSGPESLALTFQLVLLLLYSYTMAGNHFI